MRNCWYLIATLFCVSLASSTNQPPSACAASLIILTSSSSASSSPSLKQQQQQQHSAKFVNSFFGEQTNEWTAILCKNFMRAHSNVVCALPHVCVCVVSIVSLSLFFNFSLSHHSAHKKRKQQRNKCFSRYKKQQQGMNRQLEKILLS